MMKKSFYTLAALLCFTFSACEKSNEEEPDPNAQKVQLLTTGTWKFSSAGLDNDNNGVKDGDIPQALINACDTDNIVTFKTDKTGTMDEGPSKCTNTDPQSVNFNWDLTNNGNSINVSAGLFPGLEGDAKIIELSSTKLTVTKNVTYLGFTVNVMLFLVH